MKLTLYTFNIFIYLHFVVIIIILYFQYYTKNTKTHKIIQHNDKKKINTMQVLNIR